jgi:DNA polymerase V
MLLDLEDDCGEDRPQLMTALDGLNQRYGKGTALMGSAVRRGIRFDSRNTRAKKSP